MESIVTIDNVSYCYPNAAQMALLNVSLQIQRGEFLGITGATGSGKSTLCLALNGIVPRFYGGQFFGHITVAGQDTLETPISSLASHVGQVFEDPEMQLIATSVENEIAFALENLSIPRPEMRQRIGQALKMVRLTGLEKLSPTDLSGGQKQRLAIAAALALHPDLLVLDEPTSQLDPIGAQDIFATLRELNRRFGVTIVLASHAAEEMAAHVDRVALLSNGKLVALDSPGRIYADLPLLKTNRLRAPQVAQTFYELRHLKGAPLGQIPVDMLHGSAALRSLCQVLPPLATPSFSDPPPPKTEPIFSAEQLSYTYPNGSQALNNISLQIRRGEYVLVVGQNGAGKSTLVRHFLSILKPAQGRMLIDGVDSRTLSVSRLARHIGYIAQNPDSQIFNDTVEKEIAFALHFQGYSAQDIEERVEESLKAMDLTAYRTRHPFSLPRGDRARVVMAATLALRPDVVIFDEPTTGQDYQGVYAILELSRQLHARGLTVIVITHHLYLMPGYANRVVVMGRGCVLLDAPIRQAFHNLAILESTYLTPPQAVLLGHTLEHDFNRPYPVLTPAEVCACFPTTSKNADEPL